MNTAWISILCCPITRICAPAISSNGNNQQTCMLFSGQHNDVPRTRKHLHATASVGTVTSQSDPCACRTTSWHHRCSSYRKKFRTRGTCWSRTYTPIDVCNLFAQQSAKWIPSSPTNPGGATSTAATYTTVGENVWTIGRRRCTGVSINLPSLSAQSIMHNGSSANAEALAASTNWRFARSRNLCNVCVAFKGDRPRPLPTTTLQTQWH
jgi:hypothetical protein